MVDVTRDRKISTSSVLFPSKLLLGLSDLELYDGVVLPTEYDANQENLILRPLCLEDFDKGYMQLLSQLTVVGDVSREDFKSRFHSMLAAKGQYFVVVLEDPSVNRIVGSATLVVEQKFIHHAGSRGRVEDVVVNSDYRGRKLGKLFVIVSMYPFYIPPFFSDKMQLINCVTLLGKSLGVYKMSLECTDKLIPLYASCGYKVDAGNNFLIQRFKD